MSNSRISSVTINDAVASEFMINSYVAMLEKVPVLFVSGDRELCDHAKEIVPDIEYVAVKTGSGASTLNLHPKTAREMIKSGVLRSLHNRAGVQLQQLPDHFTVTISFNDVRDSYKASFFPGAEILGPRQVGFRSDSYFEVLRFFLFVM